MSVLGFRILRRPTISTPRGERHRHRRLLLEALEDRALLTSAITEFPLSSSAGANAADLLGPVTRLTQTDSADPSLAVATSPAQLHLSMTASSSQVLTGGTVTYTITVTNTGNDPATGVQVVDKLPTGFAFVGGDPGRNGNLGTHLVGSSVVSDLGTLDAGATLHVRITLRAKAGVSHRTSGGKVKNTATVTSSTADDASATVSTIVVANLMPPNQVGKDAQSAIKAAAPRSIGDGVLKLTLGSTSLFSLSAEGVKKTLSGVVKIVYIVPVIGKLPGTIKFSTPYTNPTSRNVKVDVSIGENVGAFLSAADESKVASAVRAAVLGLVKKDKALITKAVS